MTLAEYLDGMPHGQHGTFAPAVGISRQTLSSIKTGKARPSLDLAVRICIATRGHVSLEELLGKWPVGVRLRAEDPIPDYWIELELERLASQQHEPSESEQTATA